MSILITGTAGFIGFHVTKRLLATTDHSIIGIDNLNDYYDVNLKKARLAQINNNPKLSLYVADISNRETLQEIFEEHPDITHVVHLAAQAGVRYSLSHPFAYVDANLVGHLAILEMCRTLPNLKHLVYASSSSVYGANQKLPFAISDPVEKPISLYAATKRSCELMSYTYSHLFNIPSTGLRFFTVYGPWGRPDMSAFLFTKSILQDKEIAVFNHGDMRRNFTYIDDIVDGTISCLFNPPKSNEAQSRLYNIGNNRSEPLLHFIQTLENIIGKKAKMRFEPMQPGDVKETIADIQDTTRDFGFIPKTNIEAGLKEFVQWYRGFYER